MLLRSNHELVKFGLNGMVLARLDGLGLADLGEAG
jgi:hypothetical protein